MPDINLLPWREELREERKRQFLVVLAGAAILGGLVGYAWQTSVNADIREQQARNQMLQTGIDELNRQVAEIRDLRDKKSDMIDRMTVIKSLQTNRPEIVRLFDEFARAMPDGTFVEQMMVVGNELSLEGKAESNNRVSTFMRRLHDSPKFNNPNLTRVDADATLGNQGSSFSMTVQVVNENSDAEDEE